MSHLDRILERGYLPDFVIRAGIRRLNRMRLRELVAGGPEGQMRRFMDLVHAMRSAPIAVHTKEANEQHYEVPADFFKIVLGSHLKYSSCHWQDATNLDEAEAEMLELSCDRAEIQNGQSILELGCGWGSLTLFMASKYPKCRITAVSNSHSQKRFIDSQCAKRGIKNVKVITSDINKLQLNGNFDRVVSVEMFEHVRNYAGLFAKLQKWLKKGGKLFVHIFVHAQHPYLFEVKDQTDWMAKYFFTGGTMPSTDLLLYFSSGFQIEAHHAVSGIHYAKTAEAWLTNMDLQRAEVMRIFQSVYGEEATKWFQYWRIFFMACAELFGTRNGSEWLVNHYRFIKA